MSTTNATPEVFRLEAIQSALRTHGPCITIQLPAHHGGQTTASPVTLLNTHLREVEQQVKALGLTEAAQNDLLEPLKQLPQEAELARGSQWGHAIFRSPTVFRHFHVIQPIQPKFTVAGSFGVRTLAHELELPATFYILTVSQRKVGLVRCSGFHAEVAELPAGIPASLDDGHAADPSGHDWQNRSSAGSSTGSLHAVSFGTGTEREDENAHVIAYYKTADRILKAHFEAAKTPVILAGVEEDTAMYQGISTYSHLLKPCIPGSMDVVRHPNDLLAKAYPILHAAYVEREAAELHQAKERSGVGRFSTDIDVILEAAFAGRVHQLFLNEAKEITGKFPHSTYVSFGAEDLMNLAAVQTLLHGGRIGELPAAHLLDGASALAIMRY